MLRERKTEGFDGEARRGMKGREGQLQGCGGGATRLQRGEERVDQHDRLDGLAQPHPIGEDPAAAAGPVHPVVHPLQPAQSHRLRLDKPRGQLRHNGGPVVAGPQQQMRTTSRRR